MDVATDGAAVLLESIHNTVTEAETRYEVARHGCRSWFCPDCCKAKGLKLRERLLPILETFAGLQMWTFTVDPTLFPTAKAAYEYMKKRRCIARTVQDLFRWGFLNSRRYFYVLEWQKHTEQAHFHVLLDAVFIPWSRVLESWSKHRPSTAGPVVGGRPAFGTVIFSPQKTQFASPLHAARYATKYLTKVPEHGFPAWVRHRGSDSRIRRYEASRGFWGEEHKERLPGKGEPREHKPLTYEQRVRSCGSTVDVYETRVSLDVETGEIKQARSWIGEIAAESAVVLAGLPDDGTGRRWRRSVDAAGLGDVVTMIESAIGKPVEWKRGGHPPRAAEDAIGYSGIELDDMRHERYVRNYDKMVREFLENN